MQIGHWLRHRWGVGVTAVALAALPLAAGFAGAGSVSAQGPSYPLIWSETGGQVGLVEVDSFGSLQQFVVTLQGAQPNTTYTVSNCITNLDGTVICDSGATPATVTTDALGNAQVVVNVTSGPPIETLTLTDAANGADVVQGGPAVAANVATAPTIMPLPATLP
ncbi:MAG TPA: hypothetical protein VH916_01075 [Dehalococcoidia bacterium]|jgi:hypothetical protein